MRKLDKHTDVYLYKEQSGDHHQELDLMMKKLVEDQRLVDSSVKCIP